MTHRTALMIAAALIFGVPAAHASGLDLTFHLEIGAGLSHYAIEPDGIWYQVGMPHSIQRNGRVWQIGMGGDIAQMDVHASRIGLAYHVDYVNLGHARATCDCTTIDADYDAHAHRLIVPQSVAPVARYAGNGMAQGIKIAIEPYITFRGYRFGYEYGEFVFRSPWRDTVYDWPASPQGPFITGTNYSPTRLQPGRVFGFSVSRGHFTLSYEHYRMPISASASIPPFYTGAQVVMLTYQF